MPVWTGEGSITFPARRPDTTSISTRRVIRTRDPIGAHGRLTRMNPSSSHGNLNVTGHLNARRWPKNTVPLHSGRQA